MRAADHPLGPDTAADDGPRRRRHRRIGWATALTAALVAGGVTVANVASTAEAANAVGTFTVGAQTIGLNQPSDPGMGQLTPAADADVTGMYAPLTAWPIIPIHAGVARNGHLVSFGTPMNSANQGGLLYDDWDVAAGFGAQAHTRTDTMSYDSFCNSMVELPDGRLLMVGGNSTMTTMTYDPVTHAQGMGQNLRTQRWYATALRLVDDRILVLGGADYYNTGAYRTPDNQNGVAITPEIGTGTGAWTPLTGATSTLAFGAQDNRWWYPRAFNAPDGNVVGLSGDRIWRLSTAGTGSVSSIGTLPFNPKVSGSQVMYAPGKILVAGGGQPFNEDGSAATRAAAIVDITGTRARVSTTASMASPRNWLNLTVLPNGQVFANGGTRVGTQGGDDNSVRQAEVWNPANGRWTAAATAQRTRTYHSTSLLLPSGAVFTGGGGAPGPQDNLNAELYYPAALFTRGADGVVRWAARPAMTGISGSVSYGGRVTLSLGDARTIRSASLITLPSVTHSENTDQRRVPLTIAQNGATLTATLPTSKNTLPPGDYELTVVDANGVPSAAQIITVPRTGAGLVTVAPAGQVAGGGQGDPGGNGSVPLTVGASVGFEATNFPGYRVRHRGFVAYLDPVDANSDGLAKSDSSWVVRDGLSGGGVSFESVGFPGYYLSVPANGGPGEVTLVQNDGSGAFARRATFIGASGNTGQNTSLALRSDPTLFLRHQNYQLFLQPSDQSDLFRADSTFAVRTALTPAP